MSTYRVFMSGPQAGSSLYSVGARWAGVTVIANLDGSRVAVARQGLASAWAERFLERLRAQQPLADGVELVDRGGGEAFDSLGG